MKQWVYLDANNPEIYFTKGKLQPTHSKVVYDSRGDVCRVVRHTTDVIGVSDIKLTTGSTIQCVVSVSPHDV